MKTAGFAGGLATAEAAAGGTEALVAGDGWLPAPCPGGAGGLPAPASSSGSTAGASAGSDSTEDADDSSSVSSWERFRPAPLRLLILCPWASILSGLLRGRPGVRQEGPSRAQSTWGSSVLPYTPQKPGFKGHPPFPPQGPCTCCPGSLCRSSPSLHSNVTRQGDAPISLYPPSLHHVLLSAGYILM